MADIGPTPWAVEAAGLGKTYGPAVALWDVDLRVGWGERIAVLGPNGAGKTTLLRLLALLLRPSSGELRLSGCTAAAAGAGARRLVGFLGHQSALYPDLTVAENLAFYARLYRLPEADRLINALLARLALAPRRGDRARTLSRGLQQRLGLARALLHDPPLLLLDEPDTGLDAPGLQLVEAVLAEGRRTVVFSTHRLDWGRRLAARAIVLDAGRIVYDGPPSSLDGAALAAYAPASRHATAWRCV